MDKNYPKNKDPRPKRSAFAPATRWGYRLSTPVSKPTKRKRMPKHPFTFCRWRGSNPHGVATNGF